MDLINVKLLTTFNMEFKYLINLKNVDSFDNKKVKMHLYFNKCLIIILLFLLCRVTKII